MGMNLTLGGCVRVHEGWVTLLLGQTLLFVVHVSWTCLEQQALVWVASRQRKSPDARQARDALTSCETNLDILSSK